MKWNVRYYCRQLRPPFGITFKEPGPLRTRIHFYSPHNTSVARKKVFQIGYGPIYIMTLLCFTFSVKTSTPTHIVTTVSSWPTRMFQTISQFKKLHSKVEKLKSQFALNGISSQWVFKIDCILFKLTVYTNLMGNPYNKRGLRGVLRNFCCLA